MKTTWKKEKSTSEMPLFPSPSNYSRVDERAKAYFAGEFGEKYKIDGCCFRPYNMRGSAYRYEVFIENDGFVLAQKKNGFFKTNINCISLVMFEPFYELKDSTYAVGLNAVKVYAKRKPQYKTAQSIQKIFDRTTKVVLPDIKRGNYPVLSVLSNSGFFLTHIVTDNKRRFIYAVPIDEKTVAKYLPPDFTRAKKDFYVKDHCFAVSTVQPQLFSFASYMFPNGYNYYLSDDGKGYIITQDETCTHCHREMHSEEENCEGIDICPECYSNLNKINSMISNVKEKLAK